MKLRVWERVGNVPYSGQVDVLFRDTDDYGNGVTASNDWWIWRINEEPRHVGKLVGAHRNAEIGIVVAPPHIAARMRTGSYGFAYPQIA